MEFHLPSVFDQNGVNIASPIIQGGGAGFMSAPPNYQDEYNRQMDQYCHNQLNPPWYQQQVDMYRNQQRMGYDPYQQQQYNPYYYQQQQSYMPTIDAYNKAYNEGAMPLSEYIYYNTPWYTVDGRPLGGQPSEDDWYGYATRRMERRREQEKYYKEIYDNQAYTISVLANFSARWNGRDPETQTVNTKKLEYEQKLRECHIEDAKTEYQNDYLWYFVQQLPNSTQKNYCTPLKEQYITKWNEYYHHRNDKYPEHYDADEYFTWIYGSMKLDMMEDEAIAREKDLSRLYDEQNFRNVLHSYCPQYDPIEGVSLAGVKRLGVDDIEITLPPHLAKQEYVERRNKFIDSIFKDNRLNI